ncbi:MAG: methyl-accepting chemotaxis protein [Desulfovibrio sp.]|nr:methyl-accepting chemotaxis protein [Desulfovibrio sp.]
MTTKFRIISGFGVMLLIIAALALFARTELQHAAESFEEASGSSTQNTALSDLVTGSTGMLLAYNRYIRANDKKYMEDVERFADGMTASVTKNARLTTKEDRRRFYESVQPRIASQRTAIARMAAAIADLRTSYMEKVRPAYHSMYDALGSMTEVAQRIGNTTCLASIGGLWKDLASAIGSMGRFYGTLDPEDMVAAKESLTGMSEGLVRLGESISTDVGRVSLGTIRESYETMLKTIDVLITESGQVGKDMHEVSRAGEQLNREIGKMSDVVDVQTKEAQAASRTTVSTIRTVMAYAGIGSFLVGILIAAFIIVGLVRTLSRVSVFAGHVADGDLDAECRVTEKGEIGAMVKSIQTIPEVLTQLREGFAELTDRIRRGEAGAIGSEQAYKGGFRQIVKGVNASLGRLTGIIGEIPSPVVVMDGERKVRFLNKAGQALVGGDYDGKPCKRLFNLDDDGTPTDAIAIAIREKRPATAETVARPRDRVMDVSYTAIPMFDEQGNLVTILQLITDLTDIKAQQRTMLEVAKQAGEISDRVAAASEQLSSQVEQISRGAEVQRSRVESTASAMGEMNSTVLEVAGNASKASEQSELSRGKAAEGAGLVDQVVEAINGVNQISRRLQENMEGLGEQAEAIGGVMGVISDIADQTNLLALNAAIEAARAGEAGRGFAVVADEVRKLAEKTMSATQEVGSSIGAIQQSAKANMEAVSDAVRNVDDATTLANRSGDALKEIVDMSSRNATVVTSIATAAEEQSATSEEIARALEEINRIVGETTDGMVKSSDAVQDLSRMAQELHAVMGKLRA